MANYTRYFYFYLIHQIFFFHIYYNLLFGFLNVLKYFNSNCINILVKYNKLGKYFVSSIVSNQPIGKLIFSEINWARKMVWYTHNYCLTSVNQKINFYNESLQLFKLIINGSLHIKIQWNTYKLLLKRYKMYNIHLTSVKCWLNKNKI